MGMLNIDTPALTYTLSDFIKLKSTDESTYRNFAIIEKIKGIEFIDHNLVSDYFDEMNQLAVNVTLSDEEYKKYRYNPDLLAYDVYGSTQLDFMILYLNGVIDPKEFDFKTIKLLYNSQLTEFLSEIKQSESGYIAQNRAENNINE